jgi:hypothetical protein
VCAVLSLNWQLRPNYSLNLFFDCGKCEDNNFRQHHGLLIKTPVTLSFIDSASFLA